MENRCLDIVVESGWRWSSYFESPNRNWLHCFHVLYTVPDSSAVSGSVGSERSAAAAVRFAFYAPKVRSGLHSHSAAEFTVTHQRRFSAFFAGIETLSVDSALLCGPAIERGFVHWGFLRTSRRRFAWARSSFAEAPSVSAEDRGVDKRLFFERRRSMWQRLGGTRRGWERGVSVAKLWPRELCDKHSAMRTYFETCSTTTDTEARAMVPAPSRSL